MAWTGTLCSEDEVDSKAGENVSASVTQDMKNDWIKQIESFVNCSCRFNFTDAYASLEDEVKRILSEVTSCVVAAYAISYDMSGYTSRIEAENMINFLMFRYRQGMEILKDQKTVTYIKGA